jgi:two-component system, chemotaxis family, CheB/CheR fusion protein
MLVFSEQNVIKDPPFSKLDLISCRNLLIYMGGDLQKKLIPLFHYALNPGGFLFLGTSETVGEFAICFHRAGPQAEALPAQGRLHGAPRAWPGPVSAAHDAMTPALPPRRRRQKAAAARQNCRCAS